MNDERSFERTAREWLELGANQAPDRAIQAVLLATETTPQERDLRIPWRFPRMNKLVAIGLGTVAVVVALFVGTQILSPQAPGGVGGTGGQPNPTATVEPTPEPTPTAEPTGEGLLPVGPHMILTGQADDPTDNITPLTVTIPGPDWYGEVGSGILTKNDRQPPDGSGMIIFIGRGYDVYGDACKWATTLPDSPVTTVDEFVAALSSQGSRTASKPVDIILGGYAGKSITLRVPDDVDFTECDPGYGGSWDCGDGPCGWHTGSPTEIDTVYILDVDGKVMAWLTNYHTGTSAEDVAEVEAIVRSASFGE